MFSVNKKDIIFYQNMKVDVKTFNNEREMKLELIKKNEDESGFYIVDKDGKALHIPMDNVRKFKTQKISTMPSNFKDLLKVQEVADILAYLGTLPLPEINTSKH